MYLPYLPDINWLHKYVANQPVVIERYENFVKSTARNRCRITGANGVQLLSIPLEGGRDHHRLYSQLQISNTVNWQQKHWQAIKSAYGSAPYFEYYADRFLPCYETQYQYLFEFNTELLRVVLKSLKPPAEIIFTQSYEPATACSNDLRNDKQESSVKYYQVFEERNGFVPNLCALDLLFNEGPQALAILRQTLPSS
jgi:hypothetical protein